jgi:leucyl-tRNA synthetase
VSSPTRCVAPSGLRRRCEPGLQGTGVVTSVPSDSPDDFQTLTDLRKKPEYYGIDPAWVAHDPIPVLKTAKYGDMSAPALVKQLKIQSQKDTKLLAEAKELAYKEGYYNGEMVIGDFKGERVEVAKNKVRDQMVARGEAFLYSEPEGMVMSRSADECVVALCDQWYMAYGGDEWRAKAKTYVRSHRRCLNDFHERCTGSSRA